MTTVRGQERPRSAPCRAPRLRASLELRDPLAFLEDSRCTESWSPSTSCSRCATRDSSARTGSCPGSTLGDSRLISCCTAANRADPRGQSLGRSHTSPPAGTLGRCRAARIPPTLFLCHLADHQRPALDLLTNQFELRLALLLGSLPSALHLVTSSPRRAERSNRSALGGPDSRPGLRAPQIDTDAPTALTT